MNSLLRKRLLHAVPECQDIFRGDSLRAEDCARILVPKLAEKQQWSLLAELCAWQAEKARDAAQWQFWAASATARLGRFDEAIAKFSSLTKDPQWGALARQQLGELALAQGRPHEAFAWFSGIDASVIDCRLQRAYAAQLAGKLSEAAADYASAAKDFPNNANLWFNWGICVVLGRLDSYRRAAELFRKACSLQPDNLKFESWLRYTCRLACDWRDLEAQEARFARRLQRALEQPERLDASNAPSLYQLNVLAVPQALYRRHAAIQGGWYAVPDRQSKPPQPGGRRGYRLGVLSADLCGSAVGSLAVPWLEAMAAAGDELWAFSNRRVPHDPWQARARAVCHWHDVDDLSDEEVSKLIHQQDLDVLVDLSGFTAGGRPGVLAQRPARWQVGLWGFLNTTQTPWMDALVADRWMVPAELEQGFSEKVLALPVSLLACTDLPADKPSSEAKLAWGFSPDDVVIAAFNNSYKLTPRWLAGWLQVLSRHPQARLWLYAPEKEIEERLQTWVREHFPSAQNRLRFAEPLPLQQHQERLRAADLFADTFGYNAGATAVGAIQAGLPLLTCRGQSMLGRMGVSINASLGLDELIARDEADYFERADQWLASKTLLQETKEKLWLARESLAWGNPGKWAAAFRKACFNVQNTRSSSGY